MIDTFLPAPWYKRAATLRTAGVAAAVAMTVGVAIQFGPAQEVAASTVSAPRVDAVAAAPTRTAKAATESVAEKSTCEATNWPYVEKCAADGSQPTRQVRVISIDRSAPATITVVGLAAAPVVLPQVVAQPAARVAVVPQAEPAVPAKVKAKPVKVREARRAPVSERAPVRETASVVASGDTYVVRAVGRSDDRGGN